MRDWASLAVRHAQYASTHTLQLLFCVFFHGRQLWLQLIYYQINGVSFRKIQRAQSHFQKSFGNYSLFRDQIGRCSNVASFQVRCCASYGFNSLSGWHQYAAGSIAVKREGRRTPKKSWGYHLSNEWSRIKGVVVPNFKGIYIWFTDHSYS